MESDKPDPLVKQETPSKPYRRGLTPRNLTPEERSRDIQVKCQKRNNVERVRHYSQKVGHQIDVEVIGYADDEVETYANVVDRKLRDLDLRCGNKRFVDLGALTDSVNQLACGQCARETIGEVEDDVMKQFKYLLEIIGIIQFFLIRLISLKDILERQRKEGSIWLKKSVKST